MNNFQRYEIQDLLRTSVEHIAVKLAHAVHATSVQGRNEGDTIRILATGGGALNKFLMSRFRFHLSSGQQHPRRFELQECDETTINYKESLIFASSDSVACSAYTAWWRRLPEPAGITYPAAYTTEAASCHSPKEWPARTDSTYASAATPSVWTTAPDTGASIDPTYKVKKLQCTHKWLLYAW